MKQRVCCDIVFLSDRIPPDWGGGFLRAYRTAERLCQKKRLRVILTRTSCVDENPSVPVFALGRTGWMAACSAVNWLLCHRCEFNSLYVVSITSYSIFVVAVARLLGKRVVVNVTLQGADSPVVPGHGLAARVYRRWKNLQFYMAHAITVNSKALLKECVAYCPNVQVCNLPNALNARVFRPCKDEAERHRIRVLRKLPEAKRYVTFVGGLCHRKGADLLLDICPKLLTRFPDTAFLFCGQLDYPEAAAIRSALEERLGEQAWFGGPVDFIPEVLRISHLVIMPSRMEGFPNVLLESLACGCPVAATRLPGITDDLLPNDWLFGLEQTAVACQIAEHLLDAPDEVQQVLKDLTNHVRNTHDGEQYDNNLCMLLDGCGSRSCGGAL